MAKNATLAHDHLERGRRLLSRLPTILVALSEAEYDAATILAFDPDASLPHGVLADPIPSFVRRLPGNCLSYSGWVLLAGACARDGPRDNDATTLAAFLAERAVTSDTHTGAMHHDPTR